MHANVDRLDPPRWHHARLQLKALATALETELSSVDGRLLDLGSGAFPYRDLFHGGSYLGVDVSAAHGRPHCFGSAETLPIADSAVDVVLSTQQLEHAEDPGRVLSEARRVIRPGGTLLLSTHGTWVHHPDPGDYWRWTEQGLIRLVESHGFTVLRTHHQGELFTAAAGLAFYPIGVAAARTGFIAVVARGLMTVVNAIVERLDDRLLQSSARHYASASYLVVATTLEELNRPPE